MTSAVSPNPASDRVVRHPEYYITGGDVVFRVENTLFRCHRYFFTRDSAYFREKLPHPPPPGEFTKGSSDPNPFILEDTLRVDFERLLWVFYNPKYNIYEGSVEEWSSILKLAHQWGFVEVKAFALRELEQHEIPALQKILLYHAHDIDRDLLQAAYAALTARDEPISLDEGLQLGLETALQLARAREIARAPVFSGNRKSGNPRSPVTLAGVELDGLIKDLFQLSTPGPTTERPPTPHTPTGRGTPNGRNTPQISVQTNGAGSPASNLNRGGSAPTGSTATQMEPPTVMVVAVAPSKAAPTPPSGLRSTQDTGAVQRAREGAGSVAGGPSGPEPKGKEAAAAEASLDSVMHLLDISKRDSSMKKVVSDGHRSERVVSQARTDVVESKATTEAQGAASASKSVSNKKKGQGPVRKSEAAEQGSGTVRPERTRAQSEQAAATTSAQETRSERSRSRTAEPTKKEQLQINTTVPGSEHPRRDSTPTPTRESSSFSFDEHTHRPVQHKKQSSSTTTPATTSGLFGLGGFMSNFIGGGGDPGYESSSRESEDDTPMAGSWHSTKPRRDKAEAEARAKAQEATRLRLDAEAKERAQAEERARQEAEEARLEAEEQGRRDAEEAARLEAEEQARKEAEEAARLEAEEQARKDAEAARLEVEEQARKVAEEKARLKAEKARKLAEEKAHLKAEKARKDAEERVRLEAEKARKDEEEKARLEAEKARKDAEEMVRLEAERSQRDVEEKARTDKALAKKAKKAAKKREAEATADADAKAKAAEAEAEAEKMKREAEAKADEEAKAAKEKLEAEAKAEKARIKAKEDADNQARAEEEAKAKEAADREAEAKEAEEAKATADAEAEAKAIADADAEAEAKAIEEAKAIADAEARATAEKAEQEAATRAATAKAEATAAEETKKEKARKRAEKLKEAESQRAKAAEEQVAKQRAADKAARLATSSPAPSPISSRSSGGGWLFSKVTQAVSAIVTPGLPDDPRSPSRPAATGSADLFSRRPIKSLSSPTVELGPRNHSAMRQSTSNPFRDPLSSPSPSATSGTVARSSVSVLSSGTTLVSEEVGTTEEKQEDAEGEGEGTQARTASETPAAPSAEQAGGNEAKTEPAEAIADEQSTPDMEEPTQTGSDAAQPAVPDASAEQSTSSGRISSEADNTQEPESTTQNAAADPEAPNTFETPLTPPADAPVPPPVPAKEAAVVNMPSPASQETSTSSAQTTDPASSEAVDPDNAGETIAPSPEGDAAAATNSDSPDPEAVANEPATQSGADDSHATDEGSTAPQGEDAKSEKPPKLTLPMDRVRQLSTATEMSSSSVETPTDEAGSPAVEVEEEGGAGEPGTPGKSRRKNRKSRKKKGEKNSPHPASGATVNDVDNPIEQDLKPITSDPVDVPGGEGDGILVDKADSSGEDSAVFVDAPLAEAEVEKVADANTSGSDEWNDWADEREVLHN